MKRMIILILVFSAISVIGIISFQGYWFSKGYELQQKDFENRADNAFKRTVMEDVLERTAKKEMQGGKEMYAFDSMKVENFGFSQMEEGLTGLGSMYYVMASIVNKQYMTMIQATDFDSILSANLELYSIPDHYQLFFFENDSLIYPESYQGEIDTSGFSFKKEYIISESDSAFFRGPKLLVQATFPENGNFILKKMRIALAASAFLILFVIACFIFMLYFIFRQKRLSEVKNDFVNHMTHELKTPISIISAAIESILYLGGIKDEEKTKRYLQSSEKELQRLSSIIEKVLQIAAFERNEVHLKREKVNLNSSVPEILEQFKPNQDFDIQLSLPPDKLEIQADRFHLSQMLRNLIDNAIKYGQEKAQIKISLKETSEFIQMDIQDNGIGIPKSSQSKIFEKFYRVPGEIMHATKGFGLGLNYVKKIIDLHNWDIKLESELGNGSTFSIIMTK